MEKHPLQIGDFMFLMKLGTINLYITSGKPKWKDESDRTGYVHFINVSLRENSDTGNFAILNFNVERKPGMPPEIFAKRDLPRIHELCVRLGQEDKEQELIQKIIEWVEAKIRET